MKYKCPICKKQFNASSEKLFERGNTFPFCAERCKLIDLGAWLDAEYKVISNSDQIDDESTSEQ